MDSPALQQTDRTYVIYRERKLSYFGGCDYFRLSSHPAVLAALREGLNRYGLNVAASRLTTGNHSLYELLEARLARFFGVEQALLISSGYLTNLAVAQALAGSFSHVLIDDRAHPALEDAAPVFDCPRVSFRHCDAGDLERVLNRIGTSAKPILLGDGMFSRDGELAPLEAYLRVLPRQAAVLLDDAHGAGTLGRTGKGTAEVAGVRDSRIIQTITLSKAFGTYGGAVLGTRKLCDKIRARSRLFLGSTPLPLPLANAALKALEVLRTDKGLRARLMRNTQRVKATLHAAGYGVVATPSPIVSITPGTRSDISRLKELLLARGIYPSFLAYPAGAQDGYFRFAISSEHSRKQLDDLTAALLAFAVPAP